VLILGANIGANVYI